MTKEEGKIKVDGVVIEALPGTQFRVRLDNGHEVLAYLSAEIQKALHSYFTGRSRCHGNVAIRSDPRPHYFPPAQERLCAC